jgi:hypothetical protein
VPQVRVSGIPDPFVVLRLHQKTHHWLIADHLAEEVGRFLPKRIDGLADRSFPGRVGGSFCLGPRGSRKAPE